MDPRLREIFGNFVGYFFVIVLDVASFINNEVQIASLSTALSIAFWHIWTIICRQRRNYKATDVIYQNSGIFFNTKIGWLRLS